MDGMLVLLFIIVGLAALGMAAHRFGVDSRRGFGDPRSSVRDLSV